MTRLRAARLHAVSANSERQCRRLPVLEYRHLQAVHPRRHGEPYSPSRLPCAFVRSFDINRHGRHEVCAWAFSLPTLPGGLFDGAQRVPLPTMTQGRN
jgi:hypothetical protein